MKCCAFGAVGIAPSDLLLGSSPLLSAFSALSAVKTDWPNGRDCRNVTA
jgi:hypothetical protein